MLCERCHVKPATMQLTKVMNNQKYVMHICDSCAVEISKPAFQAKEDVKSAYSGLLGLEGLWSLIAQQRSSGSVKKCPVCGTTYSMISETGKLGCSECYHTFVDQVRPLLRKVHGNCLHIGRKPAAGTKTPAAAELEELRQALTEQGAQIPQPDVQAEPAAGKEPEDSEEIRSLKAQMKEAVQAEDFERAALLRDQIKELERGAQHG